MSKPNWIDAPEWANWLAQDESGRWYWYDTEPYIQGRVWNPITDTQAIQHSVKGMKILPNRRTWKETLEQRPTGAEFKLRYPTGLATNENPDANTIPPIHPDVTQAVDALRQPETSDGSTASYYELPKGATELQDLISHRDMNAQIGEIFRACYRYGLVSHSPKIRDIKKILFYAQAELERLEKLDD